MLSAIIVILALTAPPDALPDVLPDARPPRVLHVPVQAEVSEPADPATDPEPVEWVRQCGPNGCRFIPIYRPWQHSAQFKSNPANAQPSQQRHDASQAGAQDDPASGSAGRAGPWRRSLGWWRRWR